jgi:formate dehydrogenase gamma subunit
MKSYFLRFSIAQRLEHLLLVLSFTILALTGLPQKFATAGISQFIINIFGGIETTRIIHRVAATIFILEAVYHLVVLGYKLFVIRVKASMIPGTKDVKDAFQVFFYNLGIVKKHPKMGRYNFAEKVEYLAMVWGLIAMGVTGFILWNPITVANVLPGEVIPAAKAMHGLEAILAVAAILIWHFYNVHVKSFNWSMFKGGLTKEQMEEEHGEELAEIEQGKAPVPPTPEQRKKRLTFYTPIAVVFTLVAIFGIYKFVTIEQTSIDTIEPIEDTGAIYVPVTPTPAPTAAPITAATTWDGGVGELFGTKCGSCHGAVGGFSAKTYADVMKGGNAGAVIVPGDSAASLLVQLMEGDTHPVKFSAEELQLVKAWIDAGALEK